MPYLKTNTDQPDALEIFYQDYGKGKPVVLIHGWPLSNEMWEYQIADLVEAGFRVIAYDRRGFGCSSQPWTGYDYDTLAADLHLLMTQLDLRQATLVGFSMGGGEVVRYLSRYGRERVEKAVLISSVVPYMLKTEDHPAGVDGAVFEDMMKHVQTDRPAFLEAFGKQFFGVGMLSKPVSQAMLDHHACLALGASPKATLDCIRSFGYTDFRGEISALNLPLLLIHGTADKIVPAEATSALVAQMAPNVMYVQYEGAPHGLFITEREHLNADLVSFLQTGHAANEVDEMP